MEGLPLRGVRPTIKLVLDKVIIPALLVNCSGGVFGYYYFCRTPGKETL